MRPLVSAGFLGCAACFASLDGFTSGDGGGAASSSSSSSSSSGMTSTDGGLQTISTFEAGIDGGTASARSCSEIKQANLSAKDGYYASTQGELYCDMTSDGGGWTLVARTAGNSHTTPFGWGQARGTVRDDDDPYSLGVLALDLPFNELLIGRRGNAKDWGSAYKLAVTRAQLVASPHANIHVSTIPTVVGSCMPTTGPDMLHNLGYTAYEEHFHFRDQEGATDGIGTTYGLFSDQLFTRYDNCDQGGNANNKPAMLMVR